MRRVWEHGAPKPLALGLSAAAWGYGGLLQLRDALYAAGLLKSRHLPCPVISIGNLTLGGTGKTPAVEMAVKTLQEAGITPGVISRGYGRLTAGVQVVSDRSGICSGPRSVGDEPFLLARRLPGVPIVVGENRFEAGTLCVERFAVGALVLDDAFQHRTLHKDLEVVLINGRSPWGNGRLFPRGLLREPLAALARAHLVVVTRPPGPGTVSEVMRTIRRYNVTSPLVFADLEPVECWEARSARAFNLDALTHRRLLAFAGIAYPEGFRETLAGIGVAVTGLERFPDHHWYGERDLLALAERARQSGAEGLVTTEKDWVRLSPLPAPPVPLWVLGVRLVLTEGREDWSSALARLVRP
jgi:tetraacyldisaccharide 4'-kinase